MKSKNWTLLLGGLLLGLLGLTLIFPELISSKNPYALSLIKFWVEGSELKIATAPYVPSPLNPLGTDQMGRDLLAFLAYGSRLTLVLALGVTLTRFALAVPLGIAAGMQRPLANRLIDRFNLVLTTIPPLLIAILVLRMDFFSSLYRSQSALLFILTLTLVGWSKIASVLSRSAAHIMNETYILAEQAIGKRPLQIAKSHVLPHLLPEIVILFFMEIASVLTLMMQLGLFSVFVGNLKIIRDSSRDGFSYFNVTFEPEWSSLLGSARDYIRVAPWIALSAGVMFFLTVLAFNLFGEGLRLEFQKKNSRFTDWLKPLRHRSVWISALAAIVLIAVLKWPASYAFHEAVTPDSLTSSQNSALSSAEQSRQWIKSEMISLGLEPAGTDGQYTQSFEGEAALSVSAAVLTTPEGELIPGKDFVLLRGRSDAAVYPVVNATQDFFQLSKSAVSGKCLFVDTSVVRSAAVFEQLEALKRLGVKAVILTEGLTSASASYDELLVFSISEEKKALFASASAAKPVQLKTEITAAAIDGAGQNLFAKITGQEKTMAQNTLLIGMDYRALTAEKSREKISFYLNLMANLKAHSDKLGRTVVFAFFDGNEGLAYYSEHALVQNKHVNLYLDLTDIEGDAFESLAFSDELSPISRYYGFIFADQFKKNAKSLLAERRMSLDSDDRLLYAAEGLTTLNIQTSGSGKHRLKDLGQLFVKTLIENTY